MAIESINIIKKIAKRITPTDGSNIVVLFDNVNPFSDIPSNTIISVNGFLKNLKGYSKITSLQEAQLPDIRIEDSEPERRMKALDIEWKSQRKQLDLLICPDEQNWIEIGSISLIRQQGYPYRMYSLLDFFTDGLADEYGTNGKAGCRIIDVGYGLLSGGDIVTIHGSYLQEVVYKVASQPTNIYLTCNGSNNGGDDGSNNGNDDGSNNGEEKMKRVFSRNEPTEKTEGLEWIELDGNNNASENWLWLQHPTTGQLCWKTATKRQVITQQGSDETKASFIINASNIYISSVTCIASGDSNNIQINLDKLANFQVSNLKEFIAYTSNKSSESIYHYAQGSINNNPIIQIKATPTNLTEYHLTTMIEYCVIRFVSSSGGDF